MLLCRDHRLALIISEAFQQEVLHANPDLVGLSPMEAGRAVRAMSRSVVGL